MSYRANCLHRRERRLACKAERLRRITDILKRHYTPSRWNYLSYGPSIAVRRTAVRP